MHSKYYIRRWLLLSAPYSVLEIKIFILYARLRFILCVLSGKKKAHADKCAALTATSGTAQTLDVTLRMTAHLSTFACT